ncbi:BTAD domain-containing putative transcriptional regulator [Actinomadura sp. 3N508]|uniref:AfsR/SARP family transcriptional regulator n=1 Tax=Actinomadura sp. 3N508 TaxID=3375153 RepID=UPI003791E866
MDIRLLGPVEVWTSTGRIGLSATKVRTVLAMLVLARGHVVSDAKLTETLWGDEPPATSNAQIQTYVSRLRGTLGAAVEIRRQSPGYVMATGTARVDLVEFETLVSRGQAASSAGRAAEAAGILRDALALWRGPALSGVTEYLGDAWRPQLEEAKLATLEDRIGADMDLGRHDELISELIGLVATHPLRERTRGHLMLALYRCGRLAEALATYREHRGILAAELGIDPGPELEALHRRILATDASLALPARRATPRPAVAEVRGADVRPTHLPPDIADFTGRQREVTSIGTSLAFGTGPEPKPRVVISGAAGVGKTTTALHAAHRALGEYPEGRFFVDLRGSRPRPADPAEVLGGMVQWLGVPAREIPYGLDARVRLFRSRAHGRRVLVVFDDAADEKQLRPLLPAGTGSAAIVTTRRRLTAIEGVRLIDLPMFSAAEALDLLAKIVGRGRVAAEHAAAERIVASCGGLPLAVRIAGGRLAAKPHWSLCSFADALADGRSRLTELALADLEVRGRIEDSYCLLPEPARRAFRLLALLDAPRFGVWTVALALDATIARARELVEQLVDARLLEAVNEGRSPNHAWYAFHDLIRAVGFDLAVRDESSEERWASLNRLFRPADRTLETG